MLSKPAPDIGWMPFLKLFFGFAVLLVLGVLAGAIALGKVEQNTSFGLNYILGSLATLAGGFVQWAFGAVKEIKNGD